MENVENPHSSCNQSAFKCFGKASHNDIVRFTIPANLTSGLEKSFKKRHVDIENGKHNIYIRYYDLKPILPRWLQFIREPTAKIAEYSCFFI